MSRIGIISNPHAKLNKRYPERQKLLSYIAGEQGLWESTQDLPALSEAINQFKMRDVEIIAINGGDGTISRTLTAIIETYKSDQLPKIALLRGGTINMLSTNLGIKGTPEKLLYRLLLAHSSGTTLKTRAIYSIRVDNNSGFLFASGIAPRFLEKFYEHKTGPIGAVLLIARIIGSSLRGSQLAKSIIYSEFQEISCDHETPLHLQNLAVTCATVEKMPLGIPFFKLVGDDDHFFQAIILTAPQDKLVQRFHRVLFASPLKKNPDKLSMIGKKLTIKSSDPIKYTLDGEIYTSSENEVVIDLDRKIEFVVI